MRIRCETTFDCSATGVTGHFRSSQTPFQDATGAVIQDLADWNRARNQQRNWETMLQILGLRCQLLDIRPPEIENGRWCFEFSVEQQGVLDESNDFAALKRDCEAVPMICDLDQTITSTAALVTVGDNQNIWFRAINI